MYIKKVTLKWFIAMIFIFLINIMGANAATVNFLDVPNSHWARESVQALINAKAIDGFPDGSYKPSLKITREQFAKIIVLALDIPLDKNAKQTFIDIGPKHWAFYYIDAIKSFLPGYKNVDSTLNFNGGNPVLREDVAAALVKSKKLDITQTANPAILRELFKDSKTVSSDLLPYVTLAVEKKYISGYLDGTFKAKTALTRAEVAALFYQSHLIISKSTQVIILPVISDDEIIAPSPKVVAPATRTYDIRAPLTGNVVGQVEQVTLNDDKLLNISVGGRTFEFKDKIYDREDSIEKIIKLVKLELNSDGKIISFDLSRDVVSLLTAEENIKVFTIIATQFEKGRSLTTTDQFSPAQTLRVLDDEGMFYEINLSKAKLIKNGNLMKISDFKKGNVISLDKISSPSYVVLDPVE